MEIWKSHLSAVLWSNPLGLQCKKYIACEHVHKRIFSAWPCSCWKSRCSARCCGSCTEHKGQEFCLMKRSSSSRWIAAAWGLTSRHSLQNAVACGCQKTPPSLLLLFAPPAELVWYVSFVRASVCDCSRLHIALLITTTFIVIPNNAWAHSRNVNGTGAQLFLGNIDTAYLGVSFSVFSSVMLIYNAFTEFTVFFVFLFLTPASVVVELQTLDEECIITTYVWAWEAEEL